MLAGATIVTVVSGSQRSFRCVGCMEVGRKFRGNHLTEEQVQDGDIGHDRWSRWRGAPSGFPVISVTSLTKLRQSRVIADFEDVQEVVNHMNRNL